MAAMNLSGFDIVAIVGILTLIIGVLVKAIVDPDNILLLKMSHGK